MLTILATAAVVALTPRERYENGGKRGLAEPAPWAVAPVRAAQTHKSAYGLGAWAGDTGGVGDDGNDDGCTRSNDSTMATDMTMAAGMTNQYYSLWRR